MVIPIPNSGPPLLPGPPPEALEGRFKSIKSCIELLCIFVITSLVGTILLKLPFIAELWNLCNGIFVVLIGVFLLSSDPRMRPIHEWLLNHCCRPLIPNNECPSGMQCLMPFMMINCLNLGLSLLFVSSDIEYTVTYFKNLFNPPAWGDTIFGSSLWGFSYCVFAISTVGVYLMQGMCAWYACKANQEQQALASAQLTSGAADFNRSSYPVARPANDTQDERPAPATRPGQPFSGPGYRLGA